MPLPALAELVPLWRTLREDDVTALVTPALDYVGALELGTLDVRFVTDEAAAGIGQALRSFVGGLDDQCHLLFLHRAYRGNEGDIDAYASAPAEAPNAALGDYVRTRAAWLRAQPIRRTRLFLFYSQVRGWSSPLERGHLGLRLMFRPVEAVTLALHHRRLKELATLRDRLRTHLEQLGLANRELGPVDLQQLHYELLNPNLSRRVPRAPRVELQDTLWSQRFLRQVGPDHAEYTEAEQLAHEDLEDVRGHLRQGATYRRVLTLKALPESGTEPFMARALQHLVVRRDGADKPLPFTLAVAVSVQPQAWAKWRLDSQHKLVEALRSALPFLADRGIRKQIEDAGKQSSISGLFQELNEMATKVVTLSASILLDGTSVEDLDEQTTAAERAFAGAGNSTLYAEEFSQLPAFLSMLPGAGPYQLRKKGCTSRNAGDFLPVSGQWAGGQARTVLLTPSGETFRFALFDASTGLNVWHGNLVGETGSGKSTALGMIALDALASGTEAILVDHGQSWRPLTEVMGGVHIPVDLETSISPFLAYEHVLGPDGQLDAEAVNQVVRFVEICVTDHSLPAFDLVHQDVLSRVVARTYEDQFRQRPAERPLLGAFWAQLRALADDAQAHARDREIAGELHLRLRMFCEERGVYARFLNRPSQLRFDAPLLTFEMERVNKDPVTRKIALAALMQAVTSRATARRRQTLFAVDEAHEYLGEDPAAETFLASCYARMRKYGMACWTISQKFETFAASRVAPVILGNSPIKLFLWQSSGHAAIGQHLGLSRRTVEQFASLDRRPGYYSDALLLSGKRSAIVRFAPHPFAYWVLTTDPTDRRLLERAAARNPHLSRLQLLHELAARYPHGAAAAGVTAASFGRAA